MVVESKPSAGYTPDRIPVERWEVHSEISNLQTELATKAFKGRPPMSPSDLGIFEAMVSKSDFLYSGVHPSLVSDIFPEIQREEAQKFTIRMKSRMTDIYNPAVNVGYRVDTDVHKYLFGTKLYVSAAKEHEDIRSLDYSKGLVGQEKNDNFGSTRINNPYNLEHTAHDRYLARSILNFVTRLTDQGRLNLIYSTSGAT